jgi:hypothetical protein
MPDSICAPTEDVEARTAKTAAQKNPALRDIGSPFFLKRGFFPGTA